MEVRRFKAKRGDLVWGRFDYPVSRTQKEALDGIWYMLSGLPQAYQDQNGLPESGFYSQNPSDGGVIIGLHHHSITVHRSGRITPNIGTVDIPMTPTSPAELRRARDLLMD